MGTTGRFPVFKQFSNLDIMSSVEQKVVGKQLSNSFQQLHSVFEKPLAVTVNIELSNYLKYNSTHK